MKQPIFKADVRLHIDSLAPGGDGVGFQEDQKIFVRMGVPGDIADVRIVRDDGRNQYAAIQTLHHASPNRCEVVCPLFLHCGGCDFLHVSRECQTQARVSWLERLFGRPPDRFISAGPGLRYRRLARLHISRTAAGVLRVGFHERRGNRIVPMKGCPILEESLEMALQRIAQDLLGKASVDGELSLSAGTDGVWAFLSLTGTLPEAFYAAAADLVPDVLQGVVLQIDGVVSCIAGRPDVEIDGADGVPLLFPVGSFGQANAFINRELATHLLDVISREGPIESCLEMFSGAGNFSVVLAPRVVRMDTVERHPGACELAKRNLSRRNLNHVRVHQGDASSLYPLLRSNADLVVLDPPRTGDAELARLMATRHHRRIVYISCNPATLKRDVEILRAGGYTLQHLAGFDMFPQTVHLEAMAVLVRKP